MQQVEERRLEKHTRFGAGTNSKTTTKKCSSSSSSSDRNTNEAAGKNAAGILMNARRSDNIIRRRDTRARPQNWGDKETETPRPKNAAANDGRNSKGILTKGEATEGSKVFREQSNILVNQKQPQHMSQGHFLSINGSNA